MQMYNEGMMLGITYHMFYFTDYVNMSNQFTMGYSFVLTLCAILLVNVARMAINSLQQTLSARRKLANQKAYEKAYNDWLVIQISNKKNRKEDREQKRLDKLARSEKAMKLLRESVLINDLKKDIRKQQNLLNKQNEAKKDGGALSQLFSQTSLGKGLDLFAQKPQKKMKNSKADMLKLTLHK